MSTLSTLEAYDLLRFSEQLEARLSAAESDLAQKRSLKDEKEWMATARRVLAAGRENATALLERVRALPELAEVREEFAAADRQLWVDALEKLWGGITFHLGARDPILEALFPHSKFAALRKANREGAAQYAKDFDRRLKSSYVSRMVKEPHVEFARPVFEQIAALREKWQADAAEAMPEEQAADLRKELVAAGKRVELAIKQAKLLAEAALAPVAGMFEEAGLAAKPRKRSPPKPEPKEEPAPAEAVAAPAPEAVQEAAPAEPQSPAAVEPAQPVAKKRRRDAPRASAT